MSVKTQGTEAWIFIHKTKELIDIGCIDSISGIDGAVSQITTTCLRDLSSKSEGGLIEQGQAAIGIQFDPQNPDHMKMHQAYQNTQTFDVFIGFRYEDAAGIVQVPGPAPTYDSVASKVEIPEERDWILFSGYFANWPFDFQQNDVVRSALTVQISGDIVPVAGVRP